MERRRDERRERDERDECDVRVWAASSRIGSPLGGGVPVRRGGRAAARRAARWSTPRARVHLAGGRRLGRKPCRRVASRAVFTRVRSPPIRCGGTATRPEDRRAWPPTALQPQPRRADTRSAPSLGAPSRVEPPPHRVLRWRSSALQGEAPERRRRHRWLGADAGLAPPPS